jgi:hypothetical protein
MVSTDHNVESQQEVRVALRRAGWHAQGRYEAFRDVLENRQSPEEIAAEIAELESLLVDPRNVRGSWAIGTSVRRCAEGRWAGLKEILSILAGEEPTNEPDYLTPRPAENGA